MCAVDSDTAVGYTGNQHLRPPTQQVDIFFEQADQLDADGNAMLKGIKAEPVQPDLPAFAQLLDASAQLVVSAEGACGHPCLQCVV